jgi:tetratricopeptide (TPR) repeat protein
MLTQSRLKMPGACCADFRRTLTLLRRLCVAGFFAAQFSALMWSQAPRGSALLSALSEHRYAEAVQIANSALKAHPADSWLWTLRGMALEGAGETAASLESLNKALSFDARYVPALKAASQVAYQHHDSRVPRRFLAVCWRCVPTKQQRTPWPVSWTMKRIIAPAPLHISRRALSSS